jgi:hypothetical protein
MRRRLAAGVAIALGLVGGPPVRAGHIGTVLVAQVANDGLTVTIEVDVTFTGGAGGGVFGWTTGDGGEAAVPDGTTASGGYLGDASGVVTFAGTRPLSLALDTRTVTWERTNPAPNVARTRLTYNYAAGGVYDVTWRACCPERNGHVVVAVDAPGVPVPFEPVGVVEISGGAGGAPVVSFTGFVPDVLAWRCVTEPWDGTSTAVACTPPPAPAGLVNVCGTVAVLAEGDAAGAVVGTTSCALGHSARAVGGGPWFSSWADAQPPRAPFPWRCAATLLDPSPDAWRVRCALA